MPDTGHHMNPTELKKLKRQLKLTKKGIQAYQRDDFKTALECLMKNIDDDPKDLTHLAIIADCLVKLGVRDMAFGVVEQCLKHNEPDVDICMVLGKLALDMEMHEIGAKIFRIGISLDPTNTLFYNNLASALGSLEMFDESIELLQGALSMFPEDAALWNTLAVQVQYRDGYEHAIVFFREALRLDPEMSMSWNNLAIATDDTEEAIHCSEQAIKINPTNAQPYIGLAHLHLDKGNMEEGWKYYQARQSGSNQVFGSQGMIYTHNLPNWAGEDLTGKSILVCGEQGLGDEIVFGALIRHLVDQADTVYISVNNRLSTLFARAYPEAKIIQYQTKKQYGNIYRSFPVLERAIKRGEVTVDYYTPIASPAEYFWNDLDNMPVYEGGYLRASEENIAKWKDRIAKLPGEINVGISWRSGNMAASRVVQYASVKEYAPILTVEGVNFVNLQYGDVTQELQEFEDQLGVKIHTWDDFDIKKDIESNYAVAANLDLIIAPAITPGIIGMTAGTPTWEFSRKLRFMRFGCEDKMDIFPNCEIHINGFYSDWSQLFGSYRERLEQMVNSAKSN